MLVGNTHIEFGGSHFSLVHPSTGVAGDLGTVPSPDPAAPGRYRRLHALLATGRVRACHDLSEGGLAVALAEMAIAGGYGATISTLPHPDRATALFSESLSRFVCEVAAHDVDWFLDGLAEPAVVLGEVTVEPVLRLASVALPLDALRTAFKAEPARRAHAQDRPQGHPQEGDR